jgi:hypothetical protein
MKTQRKPVQELIDRYKTLVFFGIGKKLNAPSYSFAIEPYGHSIFVYVGDDWHDVYNRLLDRDISKYFALTQPEWPYDQCFTLFFPEKNVGPNTIAHEAMHVVSRVLTVAGIPLDTKDANDEPYAYLLGSLVEKLTWILDHHRCVSVKQQPRKGRK